MFGAEAKPSKRTKNVFGTRVFEPLGYFPNIALDLVFLANCLYIVTIYFVYKTINIHKNNATTSPPVHRNLKFQILSFEKTEFTLSQDGIWHEPGRIS